jgi:ATP-dependent Lon protease
MPSFSPEISYIRTYLDWLINIPWAKKDESKIDLQAAREVLDQDHYGLDKVKERILEYLAVQKLVGKIRGPILCFAGPPGTGKTSIGKSIAKSLGRKFVRISLGGIRDEAEIRGHRRTYVGALPGRIIQGICTAGTKNPIFMLDEIDKVGADFRGDPSAALLEALDPEQNYAFSDHYVEVPVDLSDVMFITTANMLDTIPPALRGRMEVIEYPGYTEVEKFHIAKKYLMVKQLEANGLKPSQLELADEALRGITRYYTREAGVRNLEREIAAVCRKVAREFAENGKQDKVSVSEADLEKYLGPRKFTLLFAEKGDEVGVVTGLAWTEAGGDILMIEATKMPGRGNLILTGHLGKVMQESVQAALSYARSKAEKFKIKDASLKNEDIHVHCPAGAIPKDGPSAGLAMATALISVLTGKKIRKDVAMTGEVTLRGNAMEIGGVKEKILAAHRAGIKIVLLPKDNEKDLMEVPENVKHDLKFVFVKNMDEVLKAALV